MSNFNNFIIASFYLSAPCYAANTFFCYGHSVISGSIVKLSNHMIKLISKKKKKTASEMDRRSRVELLVKGSVGIINHLLQNSIDGNKKKQLKHIVP